VSDGTTGRIRDLENAVAALRARVAVLEARPLAVAPRPLTLEEPIVMRGVIG